MTVMLDAPAVQAAPPAALVFDPATPASVPAARHWTRQVLGLGPGSDIEILVSELVGNAVVHGGPRVELDLRYTDGGIEITVTDSGTRTAPRDHRPDGEHGLGLIIARALAAHLTVEHVPDGRAARAVLHTPGGAR
jgi:anti-sigma regulatory factor (Ser/Thr protein kinase)